MRLTHRDVIVVRTPYFHVGLKLILAILVVTTVAHAQGSTDSQAAFSAGEKQLRETKRLHSLLLHPTFIILRLSSNRRSVPPEDPTDTPAPYKTKEFVSFQLFITQNSSEAIVISNYMSPYYEYRPELMINGDTVPYSKKAQERVRRAESEPPSGSMALITLESGREYPSHVVNLDDWYESLAPGRYQLIVRKQFARDGDWAASNPVYFEVIPRTPASPIPQGVSIELTPDLSQAKKNGIYQLSDDVIAVITVVNNSDESLKFNVIDREYGNRPHLFRDGKLVSYREEVSRRIAAKEENPRLVEIINDLFLDPKSRSSWSQGISLKDWYGPLSPGSYRLTNRHRFEIDGPWTAESAPLSFKVAPSKANQR